MNRTEMLHQMCHKVLSNADVKAICKKRGLPSQAVSSRSVLENLLISDTGVAAVVGTLDPSEIACLHLLKAIDKPVDVAFFDRIYPAKNGRSLYGTFSQRYQGAFSKVKERLVRAGILIVALAPQTWQKKTNMERWRFSLPMHFVPHLPPLLESPKQYDGEGDWRREVARDKLKTAVGGSSGADTETDRLEIVNGELHMGGQPFRADRLLAWQKAGWKNELAQKKGDKHGESHALLPAEAAVHILGGLDDGFWSDPDALAAPFRAFCGSKVDSRSVCESGWRWGCLARLEADGQIWYRLAPSPLADDVLPDHYLDVTADSTVTVDLDNVPFETLERLVTISDQRPGPGRRPVLLVTPNLIKIGRATDAVLALSMVPWLQANSSAFRQTLETLQRRRGKTIVHENLLIARIGDLSLKVAVEKALGDRIVTLGKDFIAFPYDAVGDIKRVVAKSGHVVKEVHQS